MKIYISKLILSIVSLPLISFGQQLNLDNSLTISSGSVIETTKTPILITMELVLPCWNLELKLRDLLQIKIQIIQNTRTTIFSKLIDQ